jgi:hypothetical protein
MYTARRSASRSSGTYIAARRKPIDLRFNAMAEDEEFQKEVGMIGEETPNAG